ncbi:MAG TPA: hypothetical protein VG146_03365 [Verrucomicrobiae bacterium]|nr:hypothetical protein [Verrucomicrobiae bacterium]
MWHNLWQIRGYFANSNFTVSGCDGTNIYTILYDMEKAEAWSQRPRPSWITPGLYPLDVSWQTAIPWLAFASTPYLDQRTNDTLPGCWGLPRNEADMWTCGSEVKRSIEPPFLPLEVNYIVDPGCQKRAVTNNNLLSAVPNKAIETAIFQYPPGFAYGEYKVKRTTNWNGLVLPSEFEVRRYYPRYTPRAVYLGPALVVLFEGKTRTVTRASEEEVVPKSDRPISIADFRFSKRDVGVDFIGYVSTDGSWPSQSDKRLADLFRAKVASSTESVKYFLKRKRAGSASSTARAAGLLVIACVLLFPLACFALNKMRTKPLTKG